jgi:hypothetical protein
MWLRSVTPKRQHQSGVGRPSSAVRSPFRQRAQGIWLTMQLLLDF